MNIVNCRLMALASRPQLPPLDVKSVIIIIMQCQRELRMQGDHIKVIRATVDRELMSGMDADTIMVLAAVRWILDVE